MNTTQEIFKDIKGYEGHYQISSFGRVKSLERKAKLQGSFYLVKEKILKHITNGDRYSRVGLIRGGKLKMYRIHILVWEAFGSKRRNGRKLQVDHKDNEKTNNHIDNLQLLTQRENLKKMHSHINKLKNLTVG